MEPVKLKFSKNSIKLIALAFVLIPLLLFLIFLFALPVIKYRPELEFYVFDSCGGCNIQNPCKPCTLFINLDKELRLLLAEEGYRNRVELKSYNIYFDNDRARYRENFARFGLEEIPSLPAAVFGNRIFTGMESIKQGLVPALKEEFSLPGIVFKAFGVKGNENFLTGAYEEETAVMFTLPTCEDCRKTATLLEGLRGLSIVKIETSSMEGRRLYERYCEAYGVSLEDYAVPRIFVKNSVFLGYDETGEKLEAALNGGGKTLRIEAKK
ncbi:MAG: glutaredoxin [Treponema sp.]|jgi:glutaredoxin|nr:glutaredoxin [Treponema sp.]